MKRLWIVLFVVLSISCSKDEDSSPSAEEKEILEYLESNNIDFVKTSGVYQYRIIENIGGSSSGNVMSIYYSLTDLTSGDIIDSHLPGDGDPIKLLHDAASVFPVGLDRGLSGMRVGETYGIIVPGNVGYSDYPSSAVPADAILHFEVELVSRETQTDIATNEDIAINNYIMINDLNNTVTHPVDPVVAIGNGVHYKRMSVGSGVAPSTGDSLTVNYSGELLDGSSFDALSGFKYKYASNDVIAGFDAGLAQMEQGESALIIIPSAQAYGASVRVIPKSATDELVEQLAIPAYASRVGPFEVLIFEVTLQTIH
jgi:peptidylprolyl isomerase